MELPRPRPALSYSAELRLGPSASVRGPWSPWAGDSVPEPSRAGSPVWDRRGSPVGLPGSSPLTAKGPDRLRWAV